MERHDTGTPTADTRRGAAASGRDATEPYGLTSIQKAAAAVGAVFLLIGIAGFIPGITTNVDEIQWAGHESEAQLFDIFQVSILHNIVHLAFGVLGLAAAKALNASRLFLLGGGLVYLALFVYGIVIDKESDANFVPVNEADDWLHLGLGAGMILLGAALWSHSAEEKQRYLTSPTTRVR